MNTTDVSIINKNITVNNSEVVTTEASSYYNDGVRNTDEENFPKWLIHVFFVAEVCGVLINALVVLTIIYCRRNGTISLILQMCIVNLVTIYLAVIEVITMSQHNWFFSNIHCQIHKGTEILFNTLTSYLIICTNFHVISLWNLHRHDMKNKKNPLTSNLEESDDCFITRSENSNRIISIDYRRKKNDVSIVVPSLTVWFLCVSLSLPTFASSTIVKSVNDHILCEITPLLQGKLLQVFMIMFRILIPEILLLFTFGLLIYKFYQVLKRDIDDVITKTFDELRVTLICCLLLTLSYVITSFQKYYFDLSYILPLLNVDNAVLHYNDISSNLDVYLCMLHYSGTIFRGVIFFYMLPNSWKTVKEKLCSRNIND